MSATNARHLESGSVDAPRLLETSTRLKEVRRRYVTESGDGEQFALAEDSLDSIISDLDGWLKPGGKPVEFDDLDLRLAAVEEIIESVGFPGYAHVIASVRKTLLEPVEDSNAEEEPPPAQRYERPVGSAVSSSTAEAGLDEWEIRAAAERKEGRWGRLIWSALIGGLFAAAVLFMWQGDPGHDSAGRAGRVVVDEPVVLEPTAAPALTSTLNLAELDEAEKLREETLAKVGREINLAHQALNNDDLDPALQHFAAAAAIDRHDWRVSALAGSLIESLLKQADVAFDDSDWELAADRVEVARHIARGLYFDLSEIDQTAQKHEAMTRFEDVTPEDRPAFTRAVGRAVRVTQTDGEVLFGRLEAFEDNTLAVEVYTGVDGGGVQFSKTIPLTMIRELRVFEVERASEIVFGFTTASRYSPSQ